VPLYPELFEGHVGSQVQAEFCGKRIARVEISAVEVYRLTQDVLNRETQDWKKTTALTGATLMGISCFIALLLAKKHFTK
jgi:hypothetical protein